MTTDGVAFQSSIASRIRAAARSVVPPARRSSPILPGQLLAEAVARRRGYDPDAPPGLREVTLTR
ncbi:MAG: hypothetical protein ABIZ72_10415 [Candidatus Limnocylindrales bacterium]